MWNKSPIVGTSIPTLKNMSSSLGMNRNPILMGKCQIHGNQTTNQKYTFLIKGISCRLHVPPAHLPRPAPYVRRAPHFGSPALARWEGPTWKWAKTTPKRLPLLEFRGILWWFYGMVWDFMGFYGILWHFILILLWSYVIWCDFMVILWWSKQPTADFMEVDGIHWGDLVEFNRVTTPILEVQLWWK